jgi:uncharacterized membrane-anchored protein YhcB (DUF1043 family)
MEYVFALIGMIAAAAGGFYVGRNYSSDLQEKTRLAAELNEKSEELNAFREKVTGHFEKTAELFNQVSDSYQSLYEHMANSSNQLCTSPSFHSLPKSAQQNLESKSGRPHKSGKDSDNMFDADKLYKAHNYRNQAEAAEKEKAKPTETKESKGKAKVVDIDSAKDDKNEPALDYAIKEKGIVNHNSLNIDGVKTS